MYSIKLKFIIIYIQLFYSMLGMLLLTNDLNNWMLLLLNIIIPISLLTSKSKILQEIIFLINIILFITFITHNILIWYIGFESILIPMIYLISKGSSSLSSKYRAFYRFVIYTLISGFFLLINILILINLSGSLNYYYYIINNPININLQLILFPIHFIAYIIKLPILPFHIWLPDTHGEASTSGSVILAALLLKLGGIGILRWLIPILPYGYFYYRPLIFLLGILSTIYASLITLRHIDLKKLIAYSSISHMGLILIGLISLSIISYKGIIYLLVSHGLISSLLFLLIGSLYVRTGTRIILYYKGLGINMPIYTTILFIALLFNASFPPSFSFWTEIHILTSIFNYELIGSLSVLFSLFLNGVYCIMLFCRLGFSQYNQFLNLNDISYREFILYIPLIILSLLFPFIL